MNIFKEISPISFPSFSHVTNDSHENVIVECKGLKKEHWRGVEKCYIITDVSIVCTILSKDKFVSTYSYFLYSCAHLQSQVI